MLVACSKEPSNQSEASAVEEVAAVAQPATSVLPRTAATNGARVFFITPEDGATLTNPINIDFGIEGMSVVKAGDNAPDSGHHHLLIDTDLPDVNLPIPADANHVHFGDGSTSTEVTLAPGEHTLQMLLGDHLHIPHDPPVVSAVITVTVAE
ncbi:MAG: DUF4399 domain-containing protein [Gammaproteobacteria bacterium]|nr:DUF4399 domain-containing protein [Gammaproteobacteria bacterium]